MNDFPQMQWLTLEIWNTIENISTRKESQDTASKAEKQEVKPWWTNSLYSFNLENSWRRGGRCFQAARTCLRGREVQATLTLFGSITGGHIFIWMIWSQNILQCNEYKRAFLLYLSQMCISLLSLFFNARNSLVRTAEGSWAASDRSPELLDWNHTNQSTLLR